VPFGQHFSLASCLATLKTELSPFSGMWWGLYVVARTLLRSGGGATKIKGSLLGLGLILEQLQQILARDCLQQFLVHLRFFVIIQH